MAFTTVLVPMGEAEDIIKEINEQYNVEELVFVSHEPCISGLIGALTAETPEISIDIKNGGFAVYPPIVYDGSVKLFSNGC